MAGEIPIGDEGDRIIGSVCHNRRDQASALEIDDAEYQAVKSCSYDALHALNIMACAETYAPKYQPQSRSAQVQAEARQYERTLQLLLNSSGDQCRKDKQNQLLRRLNQLDERIIFKIVLRKVGFKNYSHDTVQEK